MSRTRSQALLRWAGLLLALWSTAWAGQQAGPRRPAAAPAQAGAPKTRAADPGPEQEPRAQAPAQAPSPAPEIAGTAPAQQGQRGGAEAGEDQDAPSSGADAAGGQAIRFEEPAAADRRAHLNLMGQTNSQAGESRRNDNVFFNPIDNNALKDVNVRLGSTVTVVSVFQPNVSYFGAEYGNKPAGGVHEGEVKPGSLHGSVWEKHGNSVLNARSFFQVGGVQPARSNKYGVTVGSSLGGGWSTSFEGEQEKIRGNVNGNVLIPKPGERTPLTNDPALVPLIRRIFDAFPAVAPNRPDIDERALNTNSPQHINTAVLGAKLGKQLGARDRFAFRFGVTTQAVTAFQFVQDQHPNTDTRAHSGRATWNRIWSTRTVTDLSAGFDRVRSVLVPAPGAIGPGLSFGSAIDTIGSGPTLPTDRTQNLFLYAGQVISARGRHQWKAGAELTRRQINGAESSSHRGTLSFRNDFGRDALTNLRMGTPSRFSGAFGPTHRGFRNWEAAVFAGDDWKASNAVSLSYGIRFAPVTGPVEVNRLTPIPYGCDCNNWAPRFGLAWRLPGEWGAIRSAYGLHYGEVFAATFQQLRFNQPLVQKFEIVAPRLVDIFEFARNPRPISDPRSTLIVVDPELSTPYSHHYNLSWERGMGSGWRMQLGYVGSRSHKLLVRWRTNRAVPVPGIPQTTATVNLRRPNPAYYEIRHVVNGSRGYFDAGRVSLILPRWHGVTGEIAYWFSKAIDLGADYTNTAAGEEDRARNQSERLFQQDLKGLSSFDQPQALLLRLACTTPGTRRFRGLLGSWMLHGVVLAKNGTPFGVASGSDGPGFGNVDGSAGDRPNLADPRVLGRTIGRPETSQAMLPITAFAFMRPGEERGNLGNNVFRKGPIRNINVALSRTWRIGGERSLTLRSESVNFLNTPQFAEPTAELTSPSFGQITNTLNDGRAVEFSLKFSF